MEQSLLSLSDNSSKSHVIISNTTAYTQILEPHTKLGTAVQCDEVKPIYYTDKQTSEEPAAVRTVTSQERLKSQLRILVDKVDNSLNTAQRDKLHC